MKKEVPSDPRLRNNTYIQSWNNALGGIMYTAKTQTNFKLELLIAVVVMILSLFFDLQKSEFLCLVITVMLVLFAELVNTAVESLVDLYVDVYHPKAKVAKDVAAGAVVMTAINAIIMAYFLFFDKIVFTGTIVLSSLKSSPFHLAFVAIMLTIIGVITLKSLFNRGTPLQGGMPSRTYCNIIFCINCYLVKYR